MTKNVTVQIVDGIGITTIDRPEKRNAIDPETQAELIEQLKALDQNDDVQVIILTGSGEKVFASGADIQKLRDRTPIESLNSSMQYLTNYIASISKPIIAAVNGYAFGGGCEISLACDLRIASTNAKLGLTELGLGIIPGGGGTQRLTELVGVAKAKELIFLGEILSAEEAKEIGLVNQVVEPEELIPAAIEMAEKIKSKGPVAVRLAKAAIDVSSDASMQTALQIEKLSQAVIMSTNDKYEGTTAFLEKRKPDFKGN